MGARRAEEFFRRKLWPFELAECWQRRNEFVYRIRPESPVLQGGEDVKSGYTEDVIGHHGVLEEGIHFIAKPYTPRSLAVKLRAVLEG